MIARDTFGQGRKAATSHPRATDERPIIFGSKTALNPQQQENRSSSPSRHGAGAYPETQRPSVQTENLPVDRLEKGEISFSLHMPASGACWCLCLLQSSDAYKQKVTVTLSNRNELCKCMQRYCLALLKFWSGAISQLLREKHRCKYHS